MITPEVQAPEPSVKYSENKQIRIQQMLCWVDKRKWRKIIYSHIFSMSLGNFLNIRFFYPSNNVCSCRKQLSLINMFTPNSPEMVSVGSFRKLCRHQSHYQHKPSQWVEFHFEGIIRFYSS